MHLDGKGLRQRLETYGNELARIRSEAETERDDDVKTLLQEAQPYYEKALEYLEKGSITNAYIGYLYVEGYLGLASEEVRRSRELHEAIQKLLAELPRV